MFGLIQNLSCRAMPRHLKIPNASTRCLDFSPSTSSGFEMTELDQRDPLIPQISDSDAKILPLINF